MAVKRDSRKALVAQVLYAFVSYFIPTIDSLRSEPLHVVYAT